MTMTKNKLMAWVIALLMAFTVFGVLGVSQVNAEDQAYVVTDSVSVAGLPQVTKSFSTSDLDSMVDVTNAYYLQFGKQGVCNVIKVNKGVSLDKLIKAAEGEAFDYNSIAGTMFWDKNKDTGNLEHYSKLANFTDHMVGQPVFYEGTKYDSAAGAVIVAGSGISVKPVLALDYDSAELNEKVADLTYDQLPKTAFVHETTFKNRIFLGMMDMNEKAGFYSQSNSQGIDIIKGKADQTVTATGTSATLKVKKVKKTKAVVAAPVAVSSDLITAPTVTYKKGKVNKSKANFKVDAQTGDITVKKGTKKGKYKVTVKATVAGDEYVNEAAASCQVVIIIK